MNKSLQILSGDIGSVVNFALAISIPVAVIAGFFVYSLMMRSKSKKMLISIVVSVLVLFFVLWVLFNSFDYL